jgi:alkanesulfonate monooxygenase SsuD/methylene tetrahydromethanopterin reductase-like flavin-dependent oxidoreductase (luciferase family)
MRIGVAPMFQNVQDLDRFEALERGEDAGPIQHGDDKVWQEQLAFVDLVEPLGFDSLWTFEHRATPYILLPNPQQFLSYVAARTKRIDVGSMVTVLPWHHPVRLAENIAMLQHMLGPNRRFIMGLGRGLARREFQALGADMGESRERFAEVLDVLRVAFHQERFSYDGKFFQIPETSLRPRPLNTQVVDDAYAVWTSAESMGVAAELGLSPLTIPSKALVDYAEDLRSYDALRAKHGFGSAGRPILQVFMYCCESEAEAVEGGDQYIGEYGDSVYRHYELAGQHFATTKGYDSYAPGGESIFEADATKALEDRLTEGAQKLSTMIRDEAVVGTPAQCIERIAEITELMGPSEIVLVSTSGTMPAESAERSLRLFAEKVLPEVQKIQSHDVRGSVTVA